MGHQPLDGAELGRQILDRVLDASPNAIVAVDAAGRIAYANPQVEAVFGYRLEDLLGSPIERLVPERVADRHRIHRTKFLSQPIARPMGSGLELSGRRRDGTEFPVEISLSPVDTDDGRLVFATVVDISARKAAEDEAAASARRFQAVLEASPNAIVGVDGAGRIVYTNPRVAAVFGYAADELIGEPIETLVPPRARERHVGHRTGFMGHPNARPMGIGLDLWGRRKDGSEVPVEISLSPVETADGPQVFATVVDISARKTAEAQLLQSQKLESIGRLAGGIAHDFNNMLFAIRGYGDLMLSDLDAAPDAVSRPSDRKHLTAIIDAADRASALTAQLLAFGRQQAVKPVVIRPNDAIRSLEQMLRQLIGEHIQLDLRLGAATAPIRVDPGQLDQILVNLVVNARDAMPDGGTITIETESRVFDEPYAIEHFQVDPGPYAMISVGDTGSGMDAETKLHIFEPFFTTKETGRGTGLGLATTYGIVRQAGGHIWLYSEPGQGTVFKIFFPTVDADVTAGPVAKDARSLGSGLVLVVEDEPLVRDMTEQILIRAGYQVVAAPDAASALAILDRLPVPPDVLVSDMVMPGLSGLDLADAVAERYPKVAIVLLSGYSPDGFDPARLARRGALVLGKPITRAQLVEAIAKARAEVAVD